MSFLPLKHATLETWRGRESRDERDRMVLSLHFCSVHSLHFTLVMASGGQTNSVNWRCLIIGPVTTGERRRTISAWERVTDFFCIKLHHSFLVDFTTKWSVRGINRGQLPKICLFSRVASLKGRPGEDNEGGEEDWDDICAEEALYLYPPPPPPRTKAQNKCLPRRQRIIFLGQTLIARSPPFPCRRHGVFY